MAELTAKKYRIEEKKSNGDLQPLHPETSASVVEYTNTASGASATNAQDAIDELFSEKLDKSKITLSGTTLTIDLS